MGTYTLIHLIGGQGGGDFSYHGGHDGRMLEKIGVWVGEWQLNAIRVWLTGGESPQQFGNPSGPYKEFHFEPGERMVALSLWGNGNGTRTGWIKFKTSHGRVFDHGMTKWGKKQEYPIDVGSGICVGVKGRSGWDIDALAFVFLKPLAHASLINVHYPSLPMDGRGIAPVALKEFSLRNDRVAPRHWEFEDKVEVTSESKWSMTKGIESYTDLQVSAKIPQLVEMQAEIGWALSHDSTREVSQSETRTLRWRQSGEVPPGKRIALRAVVRRGEIHTNFTGTVQVVMQSGERLSYPVRGQYQGISYTGVAITPC